MFRQSSFVTKYFIQIVLFCYLHKGFQILLINQLCRQWLRPLHLKDFLFFDSSLENSSSRVEGKIDRLKKMKYSEY